MTKRELWEKYKTYEIDEPTICSECKCDVTNYERIIFRKVELDDLNLPDYEDYRLCKACFIGE